MPADVGANIHRDLQRAAVQKTSLARVVRIPRATVSRSGLDFAAVQGSDVYESFRMRKLVYLRFVLQKNS